VQIGLALYLLYGEVQWSLLGGLGVVVVLIPLNAYITYRISVVSKAIMICKDERLSLLDTLLRHIRTFKVMALEGYFVRRILATRAREMRQLANRKYLDAVCVYLWATTPILVSLVTFVMYSAVKGRPLTSSIVFTSLALFGILIHPLNAFPWVLNGIVEGRVSALRLDAFMQSTEWGQLEDGETAEAMRDDSRSSPRPPGKRVCLQPHSASECAICIEGAFDFVLAAPEAKLAESGITSVVVDFDAFEALTDSPASPTAAAAIPRSVHALHGISLHVHAGEFIAVHGVVGSGKSSLLSRTRVRLEH
jgi:ATP-binding cassette subfamily C (CFTR/MRP) protein 10